MVPLPPFLVAPAKAGVQGSSDDVVRPSSGQGQALGAGFRGMTERGRYLALSRTIARRRSGFSPPAENPAPAVFAVLCSKISAKCRLSASDALGFRSACVSGNSEHPGCSWLLFDFSRKRAR